MKSIEVIPSYCDSHERNFEERADFVGCGVIGVGTNETNT